MKSRHMRSLCLPLVTCGVYACTAFRQELPQLLYEIHLNMPAQATTCEEFAREFAAKAALKITSAPGTRQPGSSCYATLRDVAGNNDEVDLTLYGQTLALLVRHHGPLGARPPNAVSAALADELVGIVKTRDPSAEVKQEKVYASPLGP